MEKKESEKDKQDDSLDPEFIEWFIETNQPVYLMHTLYEAWQAAKEKK